MQEDGKSWNEVSGLLTWGLKIYLTILDLYGQGIVSAKEIIAQTKLHPFVVNKNLKYITQLPDTQVPTFIFFTKKVVKKGFLGLYRRAFLVISLLPLALGVLAFLIGFNSFFTLFHQVLFAGDNTWMFDPANDPVIWILPEEFFMHAFILFALLYEGIFSTLYFLSRKGKEKI